MIEMESKRATRGPSIRRHIGNRASLISLPSSAALFFEAELLNELCMRLGVLGLDILSMLPAVRNHL